MMSDELDVHMDATQFGDEWFEASVEPELESPPVTTPPNYYLSAERFRSEFQNCPIAVVDIQFVSGKPVELCMALPNLPILYHRNFSAPKVTDVRNRRTYEHNLNYTGAHVSYSKRDSLFRDDVIFQSLPTDTVFVIRGKNKLNELRKMLRRFQSKKFTALTYPLKFRKSLRNDRSCNSHRVGNVMCSVENVIEMCKYYNVYSDMYF